MVPLARPGRADPRRTLRSLQFAGANRGGAPAVPRRRAGRRCRCRRGRPEDSPARTPQAAGRQPVRTNEGGHMNPRWLFAGLLGVGLLAGCERDGPAEDAARDPSPATEPAPPAGEVDSAAERTTPALSVTT